MNFSDVFLVDKHIPISSVNGKKVAELLLIKINPSATSCHFPYIPSGTPRNATGHGKERG